MTASAPMQGALDWEKGRTMKRVTSFIKKEPVLTAAWVLAVLSAF